MNVGDMITRAQRLAGRVDSGYDSRTLQFLNEGLELWSLAVPWPGLRRVEEFVADGTRNLIMPQHVRSILWVADKSNKNPLEARDNWDTQNPNRYLSDTGGNAQWWREIGFTPVTAQPGPSGPPAQITLHTTVSDSFNIHVAGLVQDTAQSGTANYQYFAEEKVTIAGSGPATSANTYIRIETIGKDKIGTAADVTIKNGSTMIGRIHQNKYRSEYRNVEFLLIPGAGTILRIGYLEAPNPLTANHQVPHPSINPEHLVWYAAGLIHKAMGEAQQGELCLAHANDILQKRIYQEKSFGDRDWNGEPDYQYWGFESLYSWPFPRI